jgi:hypothetical protein
MAVFQKFNAFVEALAEKKHDLSADVLKVYLSNAAPDPATDVVRADLAEITVGVDGYTAGGNTATLTSSSQTGGIYKLVLVDPATWVSAGTLGPFRYAVLYNSSTAGGDLIGYWDYGSSLTLGTGESFKVDFDPTSGVLTLT